MIFPWICQSLFELTVFFSLDPFFWYVEMVSCRTIFEGSQEHEVILLLVIVIFVNWRTGTASIDQPEGLGMLACRWIGVWSSFSTCMRIWWLCLDDNHDFLHVELATSESTISIIWATRWTWGTCHEWRIYHGPCHWCPCEELHTNFDIFLDVLVFSAAATEFYMSNTIIG